MANKQVSKALERKNKMEEKIKEMEDEVKELEEKAQREIGKYVLKKWNVGDDTGKVFEVIDTLSDQANDLLKDDDDMGKSKEEDNPQTTP